MEYHIFIEEYYKIILYLYQLKNILDILMAIPEFIRGNLIESQIEVLKM